MVGVHDYVLYIFGVVGDGGSNMDYHTLHQSKERRAVQPSKERRVIQLPEKRTPDEILSYDMSDYYKSDFFKNIQISVYKYEEGFCLEFSINESVLKTIVIQNDKEISKETISSELTFI